MKIVWENVEKFAKFILKFEMYDKLYICDMYAIETVRLEMNVRGVLSTNIEIVSVSSLWIGLYLPKC